MTLTTSVIAGSVHTPLTPVIRVLPLPRSEPLSDEELLAAGLEAPAMCAPALPIVLASDNCPPHRGPGSRRSSTSRLSTPGRLVPDVIVGAAPRRDAQGSGATAIDAVATGNATIGNTAIGNAVITAGSPTLSPARIATRRFLAVCLEIVGGFRPASHLRPLCQPKHFGDITKHLLGPTAMNRRALSRANTIPAHAAAVGRTRIAPPRVGRSHQTGPGSRITVRRVQICEAVTDVAEVAVVLARREQVWAMALRLENAQDRWLCAHLELI